MTQTEVAFDDYQKPNWKLLLLPCADFPQAAAGLRAADGEGGGHDLRELEGAHNVQHQTAQVNTKEFQCKLYY